MCSPRTYAGCPCVNMSKVAFTLYTAISVPNVPVRQKKNKKKFSVSHFVTLSVCHIVSYAIFVTLSVSDNMRIYVRMYVIIYYAYVCAMSPSLL